MPSAPPTCSHRQIQSVGLILRNEDGAPDGVAVSVACTQCGLMFKFTGIETSPTVKVNADRTEVCLSITENDPKTSIRLIH
jgi:hypothetical protein